MSIPPASPWTYTAADYRGSALTVTATFSPAAPYTLITVTLARPADCAYSRVYFGLGGDGRPDSSARQIYVPPGAVIAGAGILAGFGFTTITDLLAAQVTAGP